ncbi:outer membrane domain protein, partial [Vibrio parahaemolyticus V-223/04]
CIEQRWQPQAVLCSIGSDA